MTTSRHSERSEESFRKLSQIEILRLAPQNDEMGSKRFFGLRPQNDEVFGSEDTLFERTLAGVSAWFSDFVGNETPRA